MEEVDREPDMEEWDRIAGEILRRNRIVFDRLAEV